MEKCHNDSKCVKKTLEKILHEQRNVRKKKNDNCEFSCQSPLGELFKPNKNNTIPFILYCNCEAFKVEGVTTCFDDCSKKEKFVCFLTFIFKIVELKDDCVVLELLKFKNHNKCVANTKDHICSPCCQLDCEDVEDLISTCVCITVDISSFTGIQCLPAVCL
ncbi:CotY/CotZ family spore coat protein [Viridibacillus sp. FSL R5-0477]|uniref:Spore coat protein n=1 Tax=Viridibacillus arenosi FSL R5-213 TaxID=1227360 RepID=W4F4Q9_9BACL|nr:MULTISPECIES: CotY/CotZ family spore coat protein [Viridibacillus]ETT87770.1 spore coat protein [Viridibacillus arenosi FSL R5-213]